MIKNLFISVETIFYKGLTSIISNLLILFFNLGRYKYDKNFQVFIFIFLIPLLIDFILNKLSKGKKNIFIILKIPFALAIYFYVSYFLLLN